MAYELEFFSLTDKPALVAVSTLEWQARVLGVLDSMGYKIHAAQNHQDFINRFTQFMYQIVVIEELFDCTKPEENQALQFVQNLPMNMRRHAVIILLSDRFTTMSPMHAFAQSVHAVIASSEFNMLEPLFQRVINDNNLFLAPFRQASEQVAQSRSE
jgi:hypothetical protein